MSVPRLSRREVLAGAATVCAPLAGCPDGTSPPSGTETTPPRRDEDRDSRRVGTEMVADGLTAPVSIVTPRPDHHIVAEQPGRILLVANGETTQRLDLRDRIVSVSGYDERGLLGLALHPDFGETGRLFVRYSAPRRAGTPDSYDHTFVLAEFALDPETLEADPNSERTILEIPQPQANHNAGDIAFGPDGLLYVPVGDGGAANDQGNGHVADWYDAVSGGNGQDVTENLLGSILRIDVDRTAGDRAYGIPDDNPLVGQPGLDEHYAWGFRNPWRLSFGPDGRLFAGDVGQDRFEEVDIVERGGNYGWNVREGGACFQAAECPTVTPDGTPFREPILTYPQDGAPVSGIAVIGGYCYDGAAIPALQGEYIFGDWQANGRLFVASDIANEENDASDATPWPTETLPFAGDGPGPFLLSFGRDADGELLIGTTAQATVGGDTGAVFRLTPP